MRNVDELTQAVERVNTPIIQEYLRGEEYTVDVLANADSEIIAAVPRQRIEVRAGISHIGQDSAE